MLSQGFVWSLAAGGGMIGFGIGILVTALRAPTQRSASNSALLAVVVGVVIMAVSIYFAPALPPQ